ncbi:MAG: DUF1624 domain-containing protein [Erysipelotrichaceae bacterium]|jgi:uncharacterized membrane protein|nr:DUF1624 domain-containing protein [Erysipelotrichaceae bacterium]
MEAQSVVTGTPVNISRTTEKSTKRIHEIDFIRGFCMLLVFMDHIFWNLSYFGSIWSRTAGEASSIFKEIASSANFYWSSPYRALVRIFVLFAFLFVSGISTAFSKSNWKRAGYMLMFYFLIQLFTNLASPYWEEAFSSQSIINFNVIGVIAWSVLFYSFVQEKSWRSLVIAVLVLSIFYLIFLPLIYQDISNNHYASLYHINVWPLWSSLSSGSHESDYMPLFPYIILFFAGALFSRFFYIQRKSLFGEKKKWENPICFIGRHSLIFYLTHQLIFVGLFSLVGLLAGWGIS